MVLVFTGGPLFHGDIEDYDGRPHIICPWHGYMFDIKTGQNEIGLQVNSLVTKLYFSQLGLRMELNRSTVSKNFTGKKPETWSWSRCDLKLL